MKITELQESCQRPDDKHYITPGRKTHLIGSQNGGFPAFGSHVKNEMGGIWLHPIKLLDGFWLGFQRDAVSGEIDWLTDAATYTNHAFYNELIFERQNLQIKRTELCAQDEAGLIVKFDLHNLSEASLDLKTVFSAVVDLQPVWYSEEAGIFDGTDAGHFEGADFIAKDGSHEWHTRLRLETDGLKTQTTVSHDKVGADDTYGKGIGAVWNFSLTLAPQESKTLYFKVAGSLDSSDQALRRLETLSDFEQLLAEKEQVYQEILDRSDLTVPDKALEKQYAWSKCHIEWLTVDSEPVGAGLAAGIPEYPWWFGVDSAYALKGCLPAGFHTLSKETLDIIAHGSQSANGNGRIIHEENSYGVVGNRGNTQETALFIHSLYQTYLWTGDFAWLKNHYQAVKKGLNWLLIDQDQDQDLFPEGFGVIEGRDLTGEVIDTAVYTQAALANASQMARLFGEEDLAAYYEKTAVRLAKKIQEEMWLPAERLFADVRASGEALLAVFEASINHAARRMDEAVVAYYNSVKEKFAEKNSFEHSSDLAWCFKNWVIDTPLEMGLATSEQAELALSRLNTAEFIGDYGSYLSGDGDKRIMTISSAVHINSNLAYKKADEALSIIHKVMSTFGLYLPGSISEMSPDYGCFVQAWTAYAMISPLITGFLGLSVNAGEKSIYLAPCLPSVWDSLDLKNVKIGKESFDFEVEKKSDGTYLVRISSAAKGWQLTSSENTRLERA